MGFVGLGEDGHTASLVRPKQGSISFFLDREVAYA